jgi:hypothetical protein
VLELLRGSQTPRLEVIPAGSTSYALGEDMIEQAGDAGLMLFPWQCRVIKYACAEKINRTTRGGPLVFTANTIVVIVGRQNGKGGILEARQLGGLFVLHRELQLHTAHQYDTSLRHFTRIERLIVDTPDLAQQVHKISHSHNEEGIVLKQVKTIILGSGAANVRKGRWPELRFKARTSGGGRGFTGDDLYFDECMILNPASIAAIVPTKSARPNTQQWYTGSAGDEDSIVLGQLRRRALDALAGLREERRMYFAEWSVDEAEGYDREDPASMVPANPSLGIMLDPYEILEDELPTFPRVEEYDRERLGVGRYPADPEESRLIPKALSDAMLIPRNSPRYMQPPPAEFALGVAVRPDRSWASISVVWRDGNEDVLDVVDRRRGTRWLKRRIRELRAKWGDRIVAVVIDDHGPGKNLIEEFEAEDDNGGPVEINPVGLDEYGDATAGLYDDMTEPGEITVAHRGHPALVDAMAGAEPRSVGDRWVWKRRGSTDITPLEAVTLARHGLTSYLAAEAAGEVVWGFLA